MCSAKIQVNRSCFKDITKGGNKRSRERRRYVFGFSVAKITQLPSARSFCRKKHTFCRPTLHGKSVCEFAEKIVLKTGFHVEFDLKNP
jgi:hypothetical protein